MRVQIKRTVSVLLLKGHRDTTKCPVKDQSRPIIAMGTLKIRMTHT